MDPIRVNFKDIFCLEDFLLSSCQKVLSIQTCNSQLELARVNNIFSRLYVTQQETGSYIPKLSFLNWQMLKILINEDCPNVNSKLTDLIIVEVLDYKAIDPEYESTVKSIFNWISCDKLNKIIFICSIDPICFVCTEVWDAMNTRLAVRKKITSITIMDLEVESKEELTSSLSILFEGNLMSIDGFLDMLELDVELLRHIFTATVVNNFIFSPQIDTLTLIDGISGSLDQTRFSCDVNVSNQIKRVFKAKMKVPDLFIFAGLNEPMQSPNVLSFANVEDAQAVFDKDVKDRPCHLIKYSNNKFIWECSKNSLENIRKYTYRGNSTISAEELLRKKAVVLIVPSSLTTRSMSTIPNIDQKPSWVIDIHLLLNKHMFTGYNTQINRENVIQLLCTFLEPHFLTSGLLNCFLFHETKLPVYIFIDGFDDIAEYAENLHYLKRLFRFLKEETNAHIWVVTRGTYKHWLEDALSIFSTELMLDSSSRCEDVHCVVKQAIANHIREYYGNSKQVIDYVHKIHQVVALNTLCLQLTKPGTFHVDISKIGLVYCNEDNVVFVKKLYSDYFLAELFHSWMSSGADDPLDELFIKLITLPQHKGTRLFLNYLLKQSTSMLTEHTAARILKHIEDSGGCALQHIIREDLTNIVDWFYKNNLTINLMLKYSTAYSLLSPKMIHHMRHYTWCPIIHEGFAILKQQSMKAVFEKDIAELRKILLNITDPVHRIYVLSSKSTTALHMAALHGLTSFCKFLIEENHMPVDIEDILKATPIHLAINGGHLETLEQLVSLGGSINHVDMRLRNPLMRSIQSNFVEITNFVLKLSDLDHLDCNGMSALHYAVKQGHMETVQNLLDRGCDLQKSDKFGMTPLCWSVLTGRVDVLNLLLASGADVDCKDRYGRSLIHIAMEARQWNLIKQLTFYQVEVDCLNFNGVTAFEQAVREYRWDIALHLLLQGTCVATGRFTQIALSASEEQQWELVLEMIRRGCPMEQIPLITSLEILSRISQSGSNNLHDTFANTIEFGNVELLQLQIDTNDLSSQDLDQLLAVPYQSLMLNKKKVSSSMQMYIEQKLTSLRTERGQNFRLTTEASTEKISLVCRILKQIILCKEVDEEFISLLRQIAQNTELLKRSVKNADIPWEQIEFCIITFINFFENPSREDFESRLIIDLPKLLRYLHGFQCLLSNDKQLDHNILENLGTDFELLRDIYSLNRISYYIKLALTLDVVDDINHLVLMRCLQQIGEYFKSSDDSPNLSKDVQNHLATCAPLNVKYLITCLRNTLSHNKSPHLTRKATIEKRLMCDAMYFRSIQKDLRKILIQIDYLLFMKKRDSYRAYQQKCLDNQELVDEFKKHINGNPNSQQQKDSYEIEDLVMIQRNIKHLIHAVRYPNESEAKLFRELESEIKIVEKSLHNSIDKARAKYFDTQSNFDLDNIRYIPRRKRDVKLCGRMRDGFYVKAFTIVVDLLQYFQQKRRDTRNDYDSAWKICSHLCFMMKRGAHMVGSLGDSAGDISIQSIDTIIETLHFKITDDSVKDSLMEYFNGMKKRHQIINRVKLDPVYFIVHLDELNIDKKDKMNIKRLIFKKDFNKVNDLLRKLDEYGKLINSYEKDKFIEVLKKFLAPIKSDVIDEAVKTMIDDEREDFSENIGTKLEDLVQIISNNKLDIYTNPRIQAAVEILMLDVLEASLQEKTLPEYAFTFDEFAPVLVSRALRNYLAHGTSFIDCLPFNTMNAIIATAVFIYNKNHIYCPHNLELPMREHFHSVTTLEDFIEAIKLGDMDKLEQHLNVYENIDNSVIWCCTLIAVSYGHVSIVKILLDMINNIVPKLNGYLLGKLQKYIQPYIKETRYFTEKSEVPTDSPEFFLTSALYSAVVHGHDSILKLLLSLHPNVNITGKSRFSILHHAAEKGHIKIVQLLLEHGADANMLRADSATPLHLAASNGSPETLKMLVQHGAQLSAKFKNNVTAIHIAASYGKSEAVQVLLSLGAAVDSLTSDDSTPLHLAARNNHADVVELLLYKKADINGKCEEITPLLLAVGNGHKRVVEILLKHHAPCDLVEEGLKPLHLSAIDDEGDIVGMLLGKGAHVSATFRGYGAIHLASIYNNAKAVDLLLDYDIELSNSRVVGSDETPLHLASHHGNVAVVSSLLGRGADVNADAKGFTPLHYASLSHHAHEEVVIILLQNNADINVTNNEGRTVLHSSALNGSRAIVELIVGKAKSEGDLTAFVNKKSYDGATALHMTCQESHVAICETLIKAGAYINDIDNQSFTPLHIAAQNGKPEIVTLFVFYKADVDARTMDGATPLHIAAAHGNHPVLLELLESDASVDAITYDGTTPLHLAAKFCRTDCVETLLIHKANVDFVSEGNVTALMKATFNGNKPVIDVLLKNGADVEISVEPQRFTPLHVAAQKGYLEIVEALIESGADVNATRLDQVVPLHLAAQNGHVEVVKILLQFGASRNAEAQGETSLDLAMECGHKDIVEILTASQNKEGIF